MTNAEIAGYMLRRMGAEAVPILQAADAAYDQWCCHGLIPPAAAGAARRAALELAIIVHRGLPVIEDMRHAV